MSSVASPVLSTGGMILKSLSYTQFLLQLFNQDIVKIAD